MSLVKGDLTLIFFLSGWSPDSATGNRGLEINLFQSDWTPDPDTGNRGLENYLFISRSAALGGQQVALTNPP